MEKPSTLSFQVIQNMRKMMLNKSYRYHCKLTTTLGSCFFFSCALAVLGYQAFYNDKGLVINHLIHFSVKEATVFYWLLTFLSLPFIGIGLLLLWRRWWDKPEILLTDRSISAPKKGISKQLVTIFYQEVTEILVEQIQGHYFLKILTDKQKLTISTLMLGNKSEFQNLVDELEKRIQLSKI